MPPWHPALHPHDHFAPGRTDRNFGRKCGKVTSARRDAELLNRALRRIGAKADGKKRGNHGITAAGPRLPPSAAQTVAELT
jgi:hypothetical protein